MSLFQLLDLWLVFFLFYFAAASKQHSLLQQNYSPKAKSKLSSIFFSRLFIQVVLSVPFVWLNWQAWRDFKYLGISSDSKSFGRFWNILNERYKFNDVLANARSFGFVTFVSIHLQNPNFSNAANCLTQKLCTSSGM